MEHDPLRSGGGGQATQRNERPSALLAPKPNATPTTAERNDSTWGGTAILVVPTTALFVMVAAVVVVNEVNHWWALIPAMLFALVSTALVMATVIRMLAESD